MHPDTASTRESFEAGRYYGRGEWVPDVSLAGPHVIRATHALLTRAGNPLRVVAQVDLDESRLMYGSFGGVLDLTDVIEEFELTQSSFEVFGMTLRPLASLLRQRA